MKIGEIGEFGFIKSFAHKYNHLIEEGNKGIGDDCAILKLNELESYVVTTDLLVEEIHFLKNKISASQLGIKSLAVSLSDVAAMGATPKFSFLSISIPKDTDTEYLDQFMQAYLALSEDLNCPLMGGDTTKSPDKLMINVVVIGQAKKENIKTRASAQSGDLICCTGTLGDSAAGLNLILENREITVYSNYLLNKHLQPKARTQEGIWLGEKSCVHALMDISDGISSDLKHILEQSKKSAIIDIKSIPKSKELIETCNHFQWSSDDLAISGGEDYELLFTVKKSEITLLQKQYKEEFGEDISVIGEITEGEQSIKWLKKGEEVNLEKIGFNHFQ